MKDAIFAILVFLVSGVLLVGSLVSWALGDDEAVFFAIIWGVATIVQLPWMFAWSWMAERREQDYREAVDDRLVKYV